MSVKVFCHNCKIELTPFKQGVEGVRCGETQEVWLGSEYRCSKCGLSVIVTNSNSIVDLQNVADAIELVG